MRFRRLEARVFGALRDRVFELPAGTALIFGPNESGKSTFRAALETILYGFDPADRDAHPLAQWEGGARDLELEAELERDEGGTLRALRELQGRGRLRVAESDAPFEGMRQGNRPLDCVSGIPREVFRSVYSLELAQLAGLDPAAQAHVDDLLLPQSAAAGLRPVGESLGELRRPSGTLAPTQSAIPRQKAQRRDRAAPPRGDEVAQRSGAARGDRGAGGSWKSGGPGSAPARAELDRAHEEAPFLRDLFELARRRSQLGEPIDLSPLSELPLADPVALAGEIEELTSALREPEARLLRAPAALDLHERALLEAAAEIALAQTTAAELRGDTRQCAERRATAATLREEARSELASVLARVSGETDWRR